MRDNTVNSVDLPSERVVRFDNSQLFLTAQSPDRPLTAVGESFHYDLRVRNSLCHACPDSLPGFRRGETALERVEAGENTEISFVIFQV